MQQKSAVKVIIAGGGTGGHLFPGIATAEELRERGVAREIVFVGTEHGIEARVIPREGYPLRFIRAEGLVGRSFAKKVRALFLFLLSLYDSRRILRSVRPGIVIG
ncbi:MAG: glycosyltransferase, partial [Nitrospirales bacterium]|nr:glycosyltransferase [Nitrospirales bacterium]